jgi:hypothetical protein
MKDYIIKTIQSILNVEFSSNVERKILIYEDRVNFRCPYCHEGRTKTKKRGNVYFNNLFYICFRCDKKTTIDTFFKDFNQRIDPDKKLEMIKHLDEHITYSDYSDDLMQTSLDKLIKLSDLEKKINQNLTNFSDFTPIKPNSGVSKYLEKRCINANKQKNIYQAKYWKNENEYEWVIVFLNRKGDNILGMQLRNLKEGKKRWFKIYNYESLLELLNIGNEEEPEYDMNEVTMYNKLSYYFNILNIDFHKKITIFEGYIDSLFYPNSIGVVGVNTDFKFLENNEIDIQYFFDNDDVGLKKSEEKIKRGFSVFLWKKLFKDVVSKKKSKEPDRLFYRINKIKDLNKLSQLVKNPYSKLKLENYFSKDILDIKWIPKITKKYIKYEKDYQTKFEMISKM